MVVIRKKGNLKWPALKKFKSKNLKGGFVPKFPE